ncbi:hypothetical protein PMAYCL1PPCAC_32582 [Pristionchus mayeri]|uniref:Uncharacterized protein n=1 Tax=Pristionchus mayeri TaxID=1317129 RepID=A0AAN5DH24_9BILA|nr:hypothetical protein PMAYCL1PPCAC_32582 [Pristionchus mayeri]
MAAPRTTILPPRLDLIHNDGTPPVVKGVKMNKGVVYTYANGHSPSNNNNIEKGGGVVQLPFLYQAPSIRQAFQDVVFTNLFIADTNHRRKNSRRSKRDVVHLPQLPNLPPSAPVFDNGAFDISQLVLRGSLKPLNPKASTSSSEAVPTTRSNHHRQRANQDESATQGQRAFHSKDSRKQNGLRQNGIIVNASDSSAALPLLSVTLPQRAKSANDVREESPSRASVTHLHAPIVQSISTQSLRETAERATQTVMYQAVASVEYLDKAPKVAPAATPYHFRRKSELQPTSEELAEETDLLMGVIEEALGQTFDSYSRKRTSQIIARNARKQAEIWRDAKDFIMGTLIPQSILMANKSRRRRQTAAEIVSNIKIYP